MNGNKMNFKSEFLNAINEMYPNGLEWELVGVLTKKSKVYTLSYDSKILSGIFEILCEPIIKKIADSNEMIVEKAKQNQYPEFTLYKNSDKLRKIAIDVKSTYRQWNKMKQLKPFAFTLGSYRSYLRNPKKGILYPYNEYKAHWVIGFLYSRNPECKHTEIKQVIEASELKTPFTDIDFFIHEKYKIAGKNPGSGNTTNIGSIKSNDIEDFRLGNGPFSTVTEFENYWRNFAKVERER
jgi:hypothetical protein